MWTNEMQAEAVAGIERLVRCPDLAAVALVLVWHRWRRHPDVPILSHVWYAALHARQGRDLPGCGTHARDALRHTTQGAGMDEVTDATPGPLDDLIGREDLDRLEARFKEGPKAEVLHRLKLGQRTNDVAADLGLSAARVSQLRREFYESIE